MSGYPAGQQFPGPPRPAGFGIPGKCHAHAPKLSEQHRIEGLLDQRSIQGDVLPLSNRSSSSSSKAPWCQVHPGQEVRMQAVVAAWLLCVLILHQQWFSCHAGFGRSGSGNLYGQPAPGGGRPNSAGIASSLLHDDHCE